MVAKMEVNCYDASSDCIVQSFIIHKWSYKMTINPYFEPSTLYNIRVNLQLSPTEAGQLAGVSRRTWEMWEKGAVTMPSDKVEKLKNKLEGETLFDGELAVIIGPNQSRLGVVASTNYCGIHNSGNGEGWVKYLMVNRQTSGAYIEKMQFNVKDNEHIFKMVEKWTNHLEV